MLARWAGLAGWLALLFGLCFFRWAAPRRGETADKYSQKKMAPHPKGAKGERKRGATNMHVFWGRHSLNGSPTPRILTSYRQKEDWVQVSIVTISYIWYVVTVMCLATPLWGSYFPRSCSYFPRCFPAVFLTSCSRVILSPPSCHVSQL